MARTSKPSNSCTEQGKLFSPYSANHAHSAPPSGSRPLPFIRTRATQHGLDKHSLSIHAQRAHSHMQTQHVQARPVAHSNNCKTQHNARPNQECMYTTENRVHNTLSILPWMTAKTAPMDSSTQNNSLHLSKSTTRLAVQMPLTAQVVRPLKNGHLHKSREKFTSTAR